MSDSPADATSMLADAARGDAAAANQLMPVVYEELRVLAASFLRGQRANHTLQTTALVHEAYLRLVDQRRVGADDRAHFFALAAMVIRRVLVDHARGKGRDKRGGGWRPLTLDEGVALTEKNEIDLLSLHEALEELAKLDERQGRIVEMRFFAGLSIEETARVLAVSPKTITDDWRMARAWLRRRLKAGEAQ